jgi:hypothetical protein
MGALVFLHGEVVVLSIPTNQAGQTALGQSGTFSDGQTIAPTLSTVYVMCVYEHTEVYVFL